MILLADAVIKYETIDSDQIDDIMKGRTPRPPQDWDDSQSNGKGQAASGETGDSKDEPGPIGGPAGQH